MKWRRFFFWLLAAGCAREEAPAARWKLSPEARELLSDERLEARLFRALDAAEVAGTDPGISGFRVRAATVVEHEGREEVVVGGNTEYLIPEAIHGETALLSQVTSRFGPEVTRSEVRFIAFAAASGISSRATSGKLSSGTTASENRRTRTVPSEICPHATRSFR